LKSKQVSRLRKLLTPLLVVVGLTNRRS